MYIYIICGPGSSVGISYWLRAGRSGDRIPVEARFLRTCSDRPWGPPSLLYNGYRVFPGGKERPGRDAYHSPTSSAVGHERVELYLYSPYGPYCLYRTSVLVQGWLLPLRILLTKIFCICGVNNIYLWYLHIYLHTYYILINSDFFYIKWLDLFILYIFYLHR
jgi:hypothetical protein